MATEHRLCRMLTLTYAGSGQQDRDGAVKDVQDFVKRLRRRVRGLRYVWVLELHPGGHGWHVHMLVDRYVPREKVASAWGHGYVDCRMIRGSREQGARNAGRYAAKYVAKDAQTAQGRKPGAQRYGRSEHLEVVEHRAYFGTTDFAMSNVERFVGHVVTWFDCSTLKDWTGPPCFVGSW